MATKDDVMAERRYGIGETLLADIDGGYSSISCGLARHLREALAELTRLRQQLDGLAEHFDGQAKGAYGSSFADGVAHANKAAAAHVRGIVKSGGADGQG